MQSLSINAETNLHKQRGKLVETIFNHKISCYLFFRLTKTNTILFGSLYAFSQSFIYFATSAAIIIGAIIFTTDRTSPFHADLIDIFQ